ncbi:MAG: hypothetical protein K9W45_04105 [Candidatus Heimdallarchaeum aukensis]|uniref:Uncharacterized protein n=1 Tax=Candidatus Heimdallarchaeum aukensis TaxID=2876573 RepID=A0A9Y1FMA0_9ARCH|nr:MAG: hypothetical protein K9W45_04105 [Candidatus Heimdallarchaeum aukensis]
MSTLDEVPQELIEQRLRYEALGLSINTGNKIASWLKVLYTFCLIILLPTLLLLSDPLKDNVTYMYQALGIGFRILLASMIIYFISKIAPLLYAAKNDYNKLLSTVGYNDPEKNTKDEVQLVRRKFVIDYIYLISLISVLLSVFVVNNRNNIAFIIGHEVIVFVILVGLILIWKFWLYKDSTKVPFLGGRLLVLSFIPLVTVWGIEIFIEFFSTLSKPRFDFNRLQLTYSLVYPIVFILISVAVLISTKKTKREKLALRKEKDYEITRKSKFIEDKNVLSKAFFKIETTIYKIKSTFRKEMDEQKLEKKLDKKPSYILVQSIWIALILSFIPLSILISWNLFPHDGIFMIVSVITAYVYSMVKYHRYDIDVIGYIEKKAEKEPPLLRKPEISSQLFQSLSLVSVVFIVAIMIVGPIITKGDYSGFNGMIVTAFSWISVILSFPLSIRLMYFLKQGFDETRRKEDTALPLQTLLPILIMELALVIGMFAAHIYVPNFGIQFLANISFYLILLIIFLVLVIPISYILVVPFAKDDKQYQIITIGFYALLFCSIMGSFVWFIFDVIIGQFS